MDTSHTLSSDAEQTMIRGGRIPWPGGPAMAQNFSLPSSIIYYIAMNPSNPEVYTKLIQTCKYFFERNPILLASTMTEKVICSNEKCIGDEECCVSMDISKITSKIWITRRLDLYETDVPNFTALLRPKIYRCDIDELLIRRKTVEFDDIELFLLSAKEIFLNFIKIVCNNGHPVMLENIFEALPNVETFECSFGKNIAPMVSASTVKNMSKLKNLGNLKELLLSNIPEIFQLDDLFAFIKDRSDVMFYFGFADDISEEYKNQLDQIIDSIIETPHLKALIYYDGQDQEKLEILENRFYK